MAVSVHETATYRGGSGEPMVVLHIGANPWKKWENVLPTLTQHHDVFIPTYAGFEGGPPLPGPATINLFADAVETEMDRAGIGRAHVVGNSLGGWIAMELARRGRALSAIAISPGGGWPTRAGQRRIRILFRFTKVLNLLSAPVRPYLLRSPRLRRLLLLGVVEHGERVTLDQALAIAGDTIKCDFRRALAISRDFVKPYPDPGIPTLVAWCERDRLTRLHPDGDVWRAAAPHAEWRVLPGLGHLPMFDDPEVVANLILDWTAKAN